VVFFWKYWFIDWVVVKFSFLLVWGLVGKSVLTKWTESSKLTTISKVVTVDDTVAARVLWYIWDIYMIYTKFKNLNLFISQQQFKYIISRTFFKINYLCFIIWHISSR
jgi:hypothetical protein